MHFSRRRRLVPDDVAQEEARSDREEAQGPHQLLADRAEEAGAHGAGEAGLGQAGEGRDPATHRGAPQDAAR